MTPWSCPALWRGQDAFIIAGGPSLAGFDFNELIGRNVIAINSSVYSAMFAPFMFFGDDRWGHDNEIKLRLYRGQIVTTSSGAGIKRANVMKKIVPPPALMTRPDALVMRRTSLQAAMNLAFHLGAKRIILMGADMRAAPDGRTHHHQPHRWPQVPGCWNEQMKDLRECGPAYESLGVEVINTSLDSLIDWWPKRCIGELL
jgi:hypothetical protein